MYHPKRATTVHNTNPVSHPCTTLPPPAARLASSTVPSACPMAPVSAFTSAYRRGSSLLARSIRFANCATLCSTVTRPRLRSRALYSPVSDGAWPCPLSLAPATARMPDEPGRSVQVVGYLETSIQDKLK